MKLTIETDSPEEAQHMLNWHVYYGACADVYEFCRQKIKYDENLDEDIKLLLINVQSLVAEATRD